MADITVATDKKTQDLIEKTTNNGKQKETPTIARQFVHFLIDFKVLTTGISLLIALQFQLFMQAFVDYIFLRFFEIENSSLILTFAALVITLLLCFLFVRFIFYKFIFTEDVAKENILKLAIQEKKKEVAKEKVENEPEAKKIIDKNTDLKIEKMTDEHFTNCSSYPW